MTVADSAPEVVAIGGGHGLAATLRAARSYAGRLTGVVSVADDGGSSGRLRKSMPIPAPGDLRKCLVALAEDGPWSRAFEYRFEGGDLDGHALGNLIISGLAASGGDFLEALAAVSKLLGVTAQVLPATTLPVRLCGLGADGPIEGQAALAQARSIASVEIQPGDAEPPQAVLDAVAEADQVLMGPGSLYTSVLAAACVPKLREAIAATTARVIYIANLAAQSPETAGYDVADHVRALEAHGVRADVVLCDTGRIALGEIGIPYIERNLAEEGKYVHHPAQLAGALSDLLR